MLLVACAAMSGLTARHDKAVSRMFADVIAVEAFLGLSRITNEYALHAFIAVLAASLAQTLFTRLSARFQSDLPERRPVAAAMLAVATHIDDAQTRSVRGTGEAATAALNAADASVARSDLSHKRRRALRKLIGDAGRCARRPPRCVRGGRSRQPSSPTATWTTPRGWPPRHCGPPLGH